MKTHLTICFQDRNADASHTQNLAKLARLRRPRHLTSNVDHIAFNLRRGLRRSYVSPRLCKRASLFVRDALPFNQLMRNFKRHFVCYDHKRRNFDRIELNSRSAKRGDSRRPRRSRRKGENSKRDTPCSQPLRGAYRRGICRSRADSVETLRTSKTSAFKPTFDPHLCTKPRQNRRSFIQSKEFCTRSVLPGKKEIRRRFAVDFKFVDHRQ